MLTSSSTAGVLLQALRRRIRWPGWQDVVSGLNPEVGTLTQEPDHPSSRPEWSVEKPPWMKAADQPADPTRPLHRSAKQEAVSDSTSKGDGSRSSNESGRPAQSPRGGSSIRPTPPKTPRMVIAPAPEQVGSNRLSWWRNGLGWLLSLVLHLAIMILFAMWLLESTEEQPTLVIVAAVSRESEVPAAFELTELEQLEEAAAMEAAVAPQIMSASEISPIPLPFTQPVSAIAEPTRYEATRLLASQNLLALSAAPNGGGFEGRTGQRRSELVASQGGTAASERAVEAGLAWLAAHQRQDGSWWLQHDASLCRCRNPGVKETSIGATGLALLPFLGAGYTHRQGPYQKVVDQGLKYLESRIQDTPHGGSLQEGASFGMYTHGIATVAFCEAYAMTQDPALSPFVEKTLAFIQNAQHPRGGWRYNPGEPGDTTVTGWQVMALKSARLAGWETSDLVWTKAGQFLDSVQTAEGCFYGYQSRKKEPGPTAVALLLRMYQGALRDEEKLERGVTYLATLGPSETDMYYNYYATQVLHHYGGNSWSRWNRELRDFLIANQATAGHEQGSWYFPDRHGTIGGRLYTTAMCLMILEVYYRHLPLYGDLMKDE
jgi:hypothetical protein